MAHIVCDADPFCYGPATTLISIVKHLRELGHRITILGTGTSLELSRREQGVDAVPCDTSSVEAVIAEINRLEGADLLLSVLGDSSVRAANALQIPVAYVDPLFWLWPSASEPHLRLADIYIIENHFGASQRLEKIRSSPRNPVVVGPILDTSLVGTEQHRRGVLVSYGGIDSTAIHSGENSNYHIITMKLLIQAAESVNPALLESLTATGGQRVIDQLENCFRGRGIRFVSLSHDDYLVELASSHLVIGIPGIGTPLEAFAYGIPISFLPPSNYSQVLQLRRFQREGVARYALSWDSLQPDCLIRDDLTEALGIAAVLERIARLQTDHSWQAVFRDGLIQILRLSPVALAQLQAVQTAYLQSIGTDGAPAAARIIHEYIAHNRSGLWRS